MQSITFAKSPSNAENSMNITIFQMSQISAHERTKGAEKSYTVLCIRSASKFVRQCNIKVKQCASPCHLPRGRAQICCACRTLPLLYGHTNSFPTSSKGLISDSAVHCKACWHYDLAFVLTSRKSRPQAQASRASIVRLYKSLISTYLYLPLYHRSRFYTDSDNCYFPDN